MVLYLVDGDNNPYKGIVGLENIPPGIDTSIRVICDSQGRIDRYKHRMRIINPKLFHDTSLGFVRVKKGNQATDNRIKQFIGSSIKQGKYKGIFVISHDKGYDKYIIHIYNSVKDGLLPPFGITRVESFNNAQKMIDNWNLFQNKEEFTIWKYQFSVHYQQ